MKVGNLNIDFVPQFGNTRHIKICELIAQANEYEVKYQNALNESRSVDSMKNKRDELVSKIEELIKQEKK